VVQLDGLLVLLVVILIWMLVRMCSGRLGGLREGVFGGMGGVGVRYF